MIAYIGHIVTTAITAGIFCALVQCALPLGTTQKSFKTVMSIFIFVCILTASLTQKARIKFYDNINSDYEVKSADMSESYFDTLAEILQKNIEKNFDKTVSILKINSLKDKDGNIYISEIIVNGEKNADIEKYILSETGDSAMVIWSDESG